MLRTLQLPKLENNLKDLYAFALWRYGISDLPSLKRNDEGYVAVHSLLGWIRDMDSKGDLVGNLALDPDPRKIEKTGTDNRHVIRTFQIWKNAKSSTHDAASRHLSTWLKWRHDSQMTTTGEGTGPSQLLDQMRTWPTDDRWDTHIENYLTANNVTADESENVRAMIDDFKDWCLNPELRAARIVQSSTATTSAQ